MHWNSDKRIAAYERRQNWHRWLALWPVHIGGGHYLWLEWIERRVEYASAYDGTYAFPQYRAATGVDLADMARRERAAKVLDKRYPKIANNIRAGMRSSTWPENLVDPGLLLDLLENNAG